MMIMEVLIYFNLNEKLERRISIKFYKGEPTTTPQMIIMEVLICFVSNGRYPLDSEVK